MKSIEKSRDALEMFFYILLRDYLPSGQVEEIMMKHVEANPENKTVTYSNPYIVAHVDDLLERMFFFRQKSVDVSVHRGWCQSLSTDLACNCRVATATQR